MPDFLCLSQRISSCLAYLALLAASEDATDENIAALCGLFMDGRRERDVLSGSIKQEYSIVSIVVLMAAGSVVEGSGSMVQ